MFALICSEYMVLRDPEYLYENLFSFHSAELIKAFQKNFIFLPPLDITFLDTPTPQVFYQVFLAYWARNKWSINLEYITLLSCETITKVLLLEGLIIVEIERNGV